MISKWQIVTWVIEQKKRSWIRKQVQVSGFGGDHDLFNSSSNLSEQYQKENIKVVCFWELEFPVSLKQIPDPPVCLFYQGVLPNDRKNIAVVGSRMVGDEILMKTKELTTGLVKSEFGIVSGLAVGVDTAAHEAVLTNGGYTVAVLATSLDRTYPRVNQDLARKIVASGGALISERPLGALTHKWNFLERNRVVSGLSEGVLVMQANKFSGSISTPNHAVDQGREVWCYVPKDGLSEGVESLIEDGAIPIEKSEEIIKSLL